MDDDLLETLLSAAADSVTNDNETAPENNINNKTRILKEANIFNEQSNIVSASTVEKNQLSVNKIQKPSSSQIHKGDTDSSDDEDNKYYEESKYNECGRQIKQLLKTDPVHFSSSSPAPGSSKINWKSKTLLKSNNTTPTLLTKETSDIYTDPIFGLRISNPIVSSAVLKERMTDREPVPFWRIKKFIAADTTNKNWVVAGVIVSKTAMKTSQNGNQFVIWSMSDLKDDIKTISMFLFKSACKELWKTSTGTVVGILNPSILDKRDGSKDEVSFLSRYLL